MKKTASEIHFDKIAKDYDYYKKKNSFYYDNLKKLLGGLIPKGRKVFEVGCGTGDLLTSLKPLKGFGMDISKEMINIARFKHKLERKLSFSTHWPADKFDYIFMSDVIEHLDDPTETLNRISKLMDNNTVFINTMANPIWEPLLLFGAKVNFKMPEGRHIRITGLELETKMTVAGLKVIKHDYKLLIPIYIPLLSNFMNKYLEKYFKKLSFIEYFVAVKV